MWGTIESRVGYDGGPGIPHFVVLVDDWPVSYCQAQFQLASLMPVELRLALIAKLSLNFNFNFG